MSLTPAGVATPPILIAFDIMYRDLRDLAGLLLSARRIKLEYIIAGAKLVLPVRRLAANGLDAWAKIAGGGGFRRGEGYRSLAEAAGLSRLTDRPRRFSLKHRHCGDLDGGGEQDLESDGVRLRREHGQASGPGRRSRPNVGRATRPRGSAYSAPFAFTRPRRRSSAIQMPGQPRWSRNT